MNSVILTHDLAVIQIKAELQSTQSSLSLSFCQTREKTPMNNCRPDSEVQLSPSKAAVI